ncbi:MAG: hypothetical protein ABIV63_11090 [Caldimonas sp.]
MLVETWLWHYTDPKTGKTRTSTTHLTAAEAGKYPDAQRVAGTVLYREVTPQFGPKRPRRTPPG